MRNRSSRALGALIALLVGGGGLAACTEPPPGADTPIIFVHGFLGSGAQYRSQAQRFASNGYAKERIRAFNYSTGLGREVVTAAVPKLDAFVDQVRRELGVDKVHLVGHSLGTSVTSTYVGDATRAAKVGKFVLVDGAPCPAGNTSCLAIYAAALGQSHVEASVSEESFAQQFRFFTGQSPTTTDIVPDLPELVQIGGYALKLQSNEPATGGSGEVWATDAATGARQGTAPVATFSPRADGAWGPVNVDGRQTYEIATKAEGATITSHVYYQPFIRSTDLIHLITSPPDAATATATTRGPNHSTLVVTRQRELWRERGARNDVLTVTAGGQTHNVFQNVPREVVGVHIHDGLVNQAQSPGVSSLALLDTLKDLPFQNGVDVFLPAASPPTGTITVTNNYRGTGALQRVAVPNWRSSTDSIAVELNDYAG